MADTWSLMPTSAVLRQVIWMQLLDILGLKRPIHLCIYICITHCPFSERIPGNAFIKGTPIFFH